MIVRSETVINAAKIFVKTHLPKELGLRFDFKNVQPLLFPPGIKITDPSIEALPDNSLNLPEPTTIQAKEFSVLFKPLQLFSGKLEIEKISLIGAELNINLTKYKVPELLRSNSEKSKYPLNIDFEKKHLKIKTIEIIDSKMNFQLSESDNFVGLIENFSITQLEMGFSSLIELKDLNVPNFILENFKDINFKKLDLLKANVDFLNKNIQIHTLAAGVEKTSLVVNGSLSESNLDFSLVLTSDFSELLTLYNLGNIKGEGDLRLEGRITGTSSKPKYIFNLDSNEFGYDGWFLNKLKASASIEEGSIQVTHLDALLKQGNVKAVGSIDLSKSPGVLWKFNAEAFGIDLQEALGPHGSGIRSLNTDLSGKIHLQGTHLPKQNLNEILINADTQAKHLTLLSKKGVVTSLKNTPLQGEIKISPGKEIRVSNGRAFIGETPISVNGVVNQITGWNIQATSNGSNIDLSYLEKIVDFNILGKGPIDLKIEGPIEQSRYVFNLNVKNFEYNLLKYGDLVGPLVIVPSKEELFFEKIHGKKGSLNFNGNLNFNFGERPFLSSQINVLNGSYTELIEIVDYLVKDYSWLPKTSSGMISGKIKVEGPPDLNKLSIKSHLHGAGLRFYNEPIENLEMDIGIDNGMFLVENVNAKHPSGNYFGSYSYDYSKKNHINLNVHSRKSQLEKLQIWKDLDIPLGSLFDLDFELRGKLTALNLKTEARFTQSSIKNLTLSDSQIGIYLKDGLLDIKGEFLGKEIGFYMSYDTKLQKDGSLHAWTNNLNLLPLFYLINTSNIKDVSLEGRADTKIDLDFPRSIWRKASGKLEIKEFYTKKEDFNISLKSPYSAEIKSGKLSAPTLELIGNKNKIQMSANGDLSKQFKIETFGEINSKIFDLLSKQVLSSSGVIQFSSEIEGEREKIPEFTGDVEIKNASLKISGIPNTFEDINGKILLRNFIVRLDHIQSNFGEGILIIDGVSNFKNHLIPEVNINFETRSTKINFLERSNARVSGLLSLRGETLPYKLVGDLKLNSVMIRDNFDYKSSISRIKTARYLPKASWSEGKLQFINLDFKLTSQGDAYVKNNFLDVEGKGYLKFTGYLIDPKFTGSWDLIGGNLFIRNNTFKLNSGFVRFLDPINFNPEFNISGESEVKDYIIHLYAGGTLNEPNIQFQSQPPLSDHDIVTLLTLGVTGEDLRKAGQEGNNSFAQTEIGSLLLEQFAVKREMKDQFGINLKLAPNIEKNEENLLTGRSSTPNEGGTTSSTQKSGAKIVIEKEVLKNVTASFGSVLGEAETSQNELNLEYRLNDTVSIEGIYEDKKEKDLQQEDRASSLGVDLKLKWTY